MEGCNLPSPKSGWVLSPCILVGEGLKYGRQQRRTIVVSNTNDGNPVQEDLLLLLIVHLDMKNEAPGQNTEEESRTKTGLHRSAKRREKEARSPQGYHGRGREAEVGRESQGQQGVLGAGMAEEWLAANCELFSGL